MWSLLKREYLVRLHRRDADIENDDEFRAMIRKLYREVPVNVDAMLRANRSHIDRYIALGEEQESSDDI